MTELELPEEPVLELLNSVSTAKRVAALALHADHFGQRKETHRVKAEQNGTLAPRKDRRVKDGSQAKGHRTAQAAGQGGAVVRKQGKQGDKLGSKSRSVGKAGKTST